MIDIIMDNIERNIVQLFDDIFSYEKKEVRIILNNNTITLDEAIDGRWVIRIETEQNENGKLVFKGYNEYDFTTGCVNNSFLFTQGRTITPVYFGPEDIILEGFVHKVSIGNYLTKELAYDYILPKNKIVENNLNRILLYPISLRNVDNTYNDFPDAAPGEYREIRVRVEYGIIFYFDLYNYDDSLTNLDNYLINICLLGSDDINELNKLTFDSTENRGMNGQYTILEYVFSYYTNIFDKNIYLIKERTYKIGAEIRTLE